MKIKHNKLRNTYLIYEMLVRQITTDTLNNKDSKALPILKKYFNNTELAKEYKIYSSVCTLKEITEAKAIALIESAISSYKKINRSKVKFEKYNLISEIKSNYDIDEFFKPKIDNYKFIASLFLLLEGEVSKNINPSEHSKYKFTILEGLSATKEDSEKDDIFEQFSNMDKGSRALVYKIMINNFNEKYKTLDGRQKSLLKEYINNISTPDKFKIYINEEIKAVKFEIKKHSSKIEDESRKVKLEELYNILVPIEEHKKVTEDNMHNLLSYYELLKELENVN